MSRHKPIRHAAGIERRVERLWYGDSVVSKAVSLVMLPFSLLFHVVVALRRAAYRRGWFASTRVAVPVVVVGNIAVGGTGKTPLVAAFVRRLTGQGVRVGIVSRGYGRATDGGPVVVAPDSTTAEVGDEPLLLARRTGVPVCVCRDRVAAAETLVREANVEIIFSDDGLQHYRLQRDLEIAVIDGARGIGNGFMLPAGPLREPADRLDTVDFVFVNGGSGATDEQGPDGRDFDGHAFVLKPDGVVGLDGASTERLETFAGQRVWALAGIGNPQRFFTTLASAGIDARPVDVPDHGRVSLPHLRDRHAWPILMTEKDAVKYTDKPVADAWYVPVDARMSPDSETLVMRRIQQLLGQG
jgi:tetraacyldisaccharide 4'-kinase